MDLTNDTTTVERMLMAQACQTKAPVNGSIELLPLCNMNCDMCYVRLSHEEMIKLGPLHTTDEWISLGRQMQKAGVLFLLLTGGEPLLFPDFRKLYIELQKMGFILTINTNATLIDEDWAQFFKEHKPRRINITLYGASDETYARLCHYPNGFTKVLTAIRLLQKNNIDIKIGSSLTPYNQHDILKIIDIGDSLGIPVRTDTYMLPATRERTLPYNLQARVNPIDAARFRIEALKKEMDPQLFAQYVHHTLKTVKDNTPYASHNMSCFAGKCSFTINWKGEMRPCVILDQPSVPIFETGFEQAWKQISDGCSNIFLNSKCSVCKLRPVCRTCAASALYETGAFDGIPEYMCQYAAESYRLIKQYSNTSD